jgi:hypothetical protein
MHSFHCGVNPVITPGEIAANADDSSPLPISNI